MHQNIDQFVELWLWVTFIPFFSIKTFFFIMNYICLSLEILVLKRLRSLIRRSPTDYGRSFSLSVTYRLLARSYQRNSEHFSRPTPEAIQTFGIYYSLKDGRIKASEQSLDVLAANRLLSPHLTLKFKVTVLYD